MGLWMFLLRSTAEDPESPRVSTGGPLLHIPVDDADGVAIPAAFLGELRPGGNPRKIHGAQLVNITPTYYPLVI